ncbi:MULTISPECIES: hypothetical protein [Micromonospora]|uniref:DUF4177 domain-containing protein n=1 Tax=Micromonospora sicca TaxID=2202420 RepID=A0A317CX35_9ACTN|nr:MULTISPECIES: hypothetical protein [unclassified Micromonospora]MBM0230080.1 hypothetical protein [Micromonospora sp. ATA51]PWR06086.1 hypothetical protein DKT69_37545 [Micromonospora sp. 4G51]
MGWINNAKANEAGKHARESLAKGNHILVYKIIEATTNSRVTAPMSGVAEQIQAIEAEGWMLANMAAAEGKAMTSERTALVCVFRRR